MKPSVFLNRAGVHCALGCALEEIAERLFHPIAGYSALTRTERYSPGRELPLGLVSGVLEDVVVSGENSRNNRLLAAATKPLLKEIERLKKQYGADRIGVVLGTSTSGIAEAEAALKLEGADYQMAPDYRHTTQEPYAPTRFMTQWLGLAGPSWSISTACTSGGKALVSAVRLIQSGLCDAVIAGGVDSLCRMTVAGFTSLNVVADRQCLPFSKNRQGINIGEAAAVFVVSTEQGPVRIAGYGESSDAYHISSPNPDGKGAILAMDKALTMAGLRPEQIDYLNLHGTATLQNDFMEAVAVNRVLGSQTACSSTKPLTGHTLAAAGALEALFCWLTLQRDDGCLPPHSWDGIIDPELPQLEGLARNQINRSANYVMSNSFAFGGNNLSLVFARN